MLAHVPFTHKAPDRGEIENFAHGRAQYAQKATAHAQVSPAGYSTTAPCEMALATLTINTRRILHLASLNLLRAGRRTMSRM